MKVTTFEDCNPGGAMSKRYRKIYLLAVAAIIAIAGCDTNPTAPAEVERHSVTGTVLLIREDGVAGGDDVEMQLAGGSISLNASVDDTGRFTFEKVPNGDYLMTPVLDGYTFDPPVQQLTVDGSDTEVGLSYGGTLEEGENIIAGRAVDSRNFPLEDITVVLYREKRYNAVVTDEDGYFVFTGDGEESLQNGRTYILTAFRNGYDFRGTTTSGYRLLPDSNFVAVDKRINICEFNYDEPLYTVTGHFIDINGIDMEGISVYLRNNDSSRATYREHLGPGGSFLLNGLPSGSYRFYFPSSLTVPTYYRFDPSSNTSVTIDGADIEIEDVYTYYIGPTYYYLNGKVVDSHGVGIPGVNVKVEGLIYTLSTDVTKDDGTYSCSIQIPSGYTETLDASVRKDGFFFDPAVFYAGKVSWRDGQREGDIIHAPTIIGYDQETYDAGAYFPLAEGNRWTYKTTLLDGSTTERITEITGVNQTDDAIWLTTSGYGPGNYRNYRVAGNDIHALDRTGSDLRLFQFGLQAGSEWLIWRESDMYDHVGGYIGAESVTVPRSEYADCEVFTVHVLYGPASDETATYWFARGVGLVKAVKTTTSKGVIVESRTDELVSYVVQQ